MNKLIKINCETTGSDSRVIRAGHTLSIKHDQYAVVMKPHDNYNASCIRILDELGESSFIDCDNNGKIIYVVGYAISDIGNYHYDAVIVALSMSFDILHIKRFSAGKFNIFTNLEMINNQIICHGQSGGDDIRTYNDIKAVFDQDLNLISKGRHPIFEDIEEYA